MMLRGMGTEDGRRLVRARLAVHVALPPDRPRLRPGRLHAQRPGCRPDASAAAASGRRSIEKGDGRRRAEPRHPRPWAVAVLVGGKAYMFDPAIGLPIPSPDGQGVATRTRPSNDPRVIAQLDLPIRDYEPSRRDLAAGPVTASCWRPAWARSRPR